MLTKSTFHEPEAKNDVSRRKFLGKLGGVAAITAVAASCQKTMSSDKLSANSVDDASAYGSFGTGDVAILNYAYLLEQLESAFYIMVTDSFYSGAKTWEKTRLSQIRDHEIAHREFFKTALATAAIPDVVFDFSSIDFSSRSSVLGSAKAFEDTGVSAYNGAAQLIQSPDYLVVAGKIVSVEARHAAYIRDLLAINTFADNTVINYAGLDLAASPVDVFKIVKPYIKSTMNMKGFPSN